MVSIKASELEQSEKDLKIKAKEFCQRQQRLALSRIMNKPWREDQEAMIAAFSKWVMFTMFDDAVKQKDTAESLRAEKSELVTAWNELERRKQELSVLERKVDSESNELQIQKEQIKQAESRLKAGEAEFLKRKQLLEQEIASVRIAIGNEHAELEKERASLAESSRLLAAQKVELEGMERSKVLEDAQGKSAQSLAFSKILDQTLDEERGWMQQAAEIIAQREAQLDRQGVQLLKLEKELKEKERRLNADLRDFQKAQIRVRNLADQLQQKEAELKERENLVGVKLQDCQDASHRVQKLALQLKAKEEGIARDLKRLAERTDAIEVTKSELQAWQDDLHRRSTRPEGL